MFHGVQVPVHHFANTLFMTIGSKTEIYAVFPRLRDCSPGRKTKAIDIKYVRLWLDKVVLPSARKVFGDAVVRHWPLSFQNHVWRDKKYGRQLNARYGVPAEQLYDGVPAVKAFLLAIEDVTGSSEDPDMQLLHGVRYVIQRQNEKMNVRVNDVFGSRANPEECLENAIAHIAEATFVQWIDVKPADTHVDVALEMSSRDSAWSPYPMQSCHKYLLEWYYGMESESAASKVSLAGRKSESTQYKCHCTCGLPGIASMHYRPAEETRKQIREMKVYSTGKEYTYSKQSKYGFQQPAMASFLSDNTTIGYYFTNLLMTLKDAGSKGQSAVRIEWTIPLTRLRSAQIIPNPEIIQRIAKVENGAIW